MLFKCTAEWSWTVFSTCHTSRFKNKSLQLFLNHKDHCTKKASCWIFLLCLSRTQLRGKWGNFNQTAILPCCCIGLNLCNKRAGIHQDSSICLKIDLMFPLKSPLQSMILRLPIFKHFPVLWCFSVVSGWMVFVSHWPPLCSCSICSTSCIICANSVCSAPTGHHPSQLNTVQMFLSTIDAVLRK